MKKRIIGALLSVTLILSFSSCTIPANIKSDKKDVMTSVLNNKQIIKDIEYESISIVPIKDSKYIVNLKSVDNWANVLWLVEYKNNVISSSKPISCVTGEVLSLASVTVSGEEFIEVSVAKNDGSGSVLLISEKDLSRPKHEFGDTVDKKLEGKIDPALAEKYKLPIIGDVFGAGYSFVYEDGRLKTKYSDINNDEKTDITFYGTRKIMQNNTAAPALMEYVERSYVFDENSGKFIAEKEKNNIIYCVK